MGIAGAFITLAFPYFILTTNPQVEASQSLCPMKLLTGLPCPGCGITKSLVFAYRGEIYKSLSYHILGFPVIIACIITVMVLGLELITGKEYFHTILYSRRLAYCLALMLGGYHLIRTIVFICRHSWGDILHESIWM